MAIRRVFEQYRGFRYFKDNVSILVKAISRTKKDVSLTDKQLTSYGQALLEFFNSMEGLMINKENDGLILQSEDFPEFRNQSLFKYVPEPVVKNYILKGSFQLGSINYYRQTENQKIQDKLEGYSNIVINSNQRQLNITLTSGFNFYIFCGTICSNVNNQMSSKFGQKIIEIPNILAFAKAVQKSIGAIRFYINRVQYADLKIFNINDNSFDVEAATSPDINENVFNRLYNYSFLPSLFVKPSGFSPEKEIRIVFEMPRDTKKIIRISNKGLLHYIKIK
jgi:hypothetical protein